MTLFLIGLLVAMFFLYKKFGPLLDESERETARREAEALRKWMRSQFAKAHQQINGRPEVVKPPSEAVGIKAVLDMSDADIDARLRTLDPIVVDPGILTANGLDDVDDDTLAAHGIFRDEAVKWLKTASLDELTKFHTKLKADRKRDKLALKTLTEEIDLRLGRLFEDGSDA